MSESKMYISRNDKYRYAGIDNCMACEKEYIFEEDKNAYVIVVGSSSCNNDISLDLEIISKCPYCEHSLKIYRKTKSK